ncbi:hypothetical protein GGTG_09251 [Gaeumannomyces tritici R3-111a-1]|uniref:Uncharacterized protein n=1 Tax=Gaeumannomyces tritici (strain R3-111a-1) TaxID=644352 RepID=J3P6V9_GAET3|nr:hypothetical protein GGTG_09251 [Gaeumannomyces tritici R3-111a-1]EJT72385.1 hypothetical protein GGTG_09251 [Gaeumannomyces tritici R3-111a-1]
MDRIVGSLDWASSQQDEDGAVNVPAATHPEHMFSSFFLDEEECVGIQGLVMIRTSKKSDRRASLKLGWKTCGGPLSLAG